MATLSNGEEFFLKPLLQEDEDDSEFAAEVEALRQSKSFQAFLDERLNFQRSRPIEDVLASTEAELSATENSE